MHKNPSKPPMQKKTLKTPFLIPETPPMGQHVLQARSWSTAASRGPQEGCLIWESGHGSVSKRGGGVPYGGHCRDLFCNLLLLGYWFFGAYGNKNWPLAKPAGFWFAAHLGARDGPVRSLSEVLSLVLAQIQKRRELFIFRRQTQARSNSGSCFRSQAAAPSRVSHS